MACTGVKNLNDGYFEKNNFVKYAIISLCLVRYECDAVFTDKKMSEAT